MIRLLSTFSGASEERIHRGIRIFLTQVGCGSHRLGFIILLQAFVAGFWALIAWGGMGQ